MNLQCDFRRKPQRAAYVDGGSPRNRHTAGCEKSFTHVTLVHLHNDESNGTIHTTTCVHS